MTHSTLKMVNDNSFTIEQQQEKLKSMQMTFTSQSSDKRIVLTKTHLIGKKDIKKQDAYIQQLHNDAL